MSPEFFAFSLAFIASLGTFIGGLVVCLIALLTGKASSNALIGSLQAGSAGVMLYMVFLDLIPESIMKIGTRQTMSYFFVGFVLFMILEALVIPEDDHANHSHSTQIAPASADEAISSDSGRPGLRKRKSPIATKQQASFGPESRTDTKDLKRMGFVVFLSLFLHNIPEGLGVYLATMLGIQLAVAIMLHNIPEGMACAIPLMASSKSYVYVLAMTLLNGLAEPLGVLVGGYLLKDYMTPDILSKCLALVAGIMACISLHELQPTAIAYSGKNVASISLFSGMFVCFVALETVHSMLHH